MFISKNLNINEKGNLTIGGVDTIELVKDYKTPLYVIDEALIRENCGEFKNALDKYFNGNGMICYASKAFCCKEICRIMNEENIGLDVVSGGELYTAISVGFPTNRICFHGNNKTDDELTLAIRHGVERIVVDNITELERISALSVKHHKTTGILLRIKPGVDAHTHEFIRTGQIDSKFGFALETGEAFEAIKKAIACENIELRGLHCHIGSQIFEIEPFQLAANVMLGLIAKVKNELGYEIKELNLGGGFGIKYTSEDSPKSYDTMLEQISQTVNKTCDFYKINQPFIIFEPGRSIVGPAGITLYKVGSVKDIPNVRTYVSVDGGMTDNPRYALYKSKYDMLIANKAGQPKDFVATIAGKCCESGDLLGEGVLIQKPEVNDVLAVLSTGAYNYSMASHYNRITKPAVVSVNKGKIKLIVKRENIDDIIKNDI
jgi:diaminopimelate decarboxylase